MLSLGKVKEVERLLAMGTLSYRRVAAMVGVSRATVSAIARGARPSYDQRVRSRLQEPEPLGPIERCPGCGGRVYMPCRLCRVRKLKAQEQATLRAMRREAHKRKMTRLLAAVQRAG